MFALIFVILSGSVVVQSSRKSLASDPQRRNTDQNSAGLGLMVLSDLQSMAREEGEGMETTETESPSPVLTPLPSLEHLLMSPDPKQGVLDGRSAPCNSYFMKAACTVFHLSQKSKQDDQNECWLLIRLPFLFGSINGDSERGQNKTSLYIIYLSSFVETRK